MGGLLLSTIAVKECSSRSHAHMSVVKLLLENVLRHGPANLHIVAHVTLPCCAMICRDMRAYTLVSMCLDTQCDIVMLICM